MSELQDLEITMHKSALSKQTELAKAGKQKQLALGKNNSGAGTDDAGQTKDETLNLARKQMHGIVSGNRQVKLSKVGE